MAPKKDRGRYFWVKVGAVSFSLCSESLFGLPKMSTYRVSARRRAERSMATRRRALVEMINLPVRWRQIKTLCRACSIWSWRAEQLCLEVMCENFSDIWSCCALSSQLPSYMYSSLSHSYSKYQRLGSQVDNYQPGNNVSVFPPIPGIL